MNTERIILIVDVLILSWLVYTWYRIKILMSLFGPIRGTSQSAPTTAPRRRASLNTDVDRDDIRSR